MGIMTKLNRLQVKANNSTCPLKAIQTQLGRFLKGKALPPPAYNGMSWSLIDAAFENTDVGVMMISLDSLKSYYATPQR